MAKSQLNNKFPTKSKKKPVATKKVDKWQNKQISKLISLSTPEMKKYRANVTATSVSSTGAIFDLTSLITQGTSGAQRIGDKYKIYSILIRGYTQASDVTNLMRMMLVRNVVGNLILGDFPPIISMQDPDKIYTYRDRTVPLASNFDGVAIVYPQKIFTLLLKFPKGITVDMSNAGSGRIKNQILFYYVSDSASVPHPVIAYDYIINFTDA